MSENVVIFPAKEGDTGDENDHGQRCLRIWLNRSEREFLARAQQVLNVKTQAEAMRACMAIAAARMGLCV